MVFHQGDILRRNQKFKEYAAAFPNRVKEFTEFYEVITPSNGDPYCRVVPSLERVRIGKRAFLKAEWVETEEYA